MKVLFTLLCFLFSLIIVHAQDSQSNKNLKDFIYSIFDSKISDSSIVDKYVYVSSDSTRLMWIELIKQSRNDVSDEILNLQEYRDDVINDSLTFYDFYKFPIEDQLKFRHLESSLYKDIYQINRKKGLSRFVLMKDHKILSLVWSGEAKGFFLTF